MKKQLSEKQKEQIKNAGKAGRDKIAKFRKGKTYDEIYGKEKADDIKNKLKREKAWNSGVSSKNDSRILSGDNHPRTGETLDSKTKEQISESLKEFYKTPEGEIVRQKTIKRRETQIFPKKDTSIEIKVQNILKDNNIEFDTHKFIEEIEHSYQCDIIIPRIRLIIECDGCYWHGCNNCNKDISEKIQKQIEVDKIRTKELVECGYYIVRLWEHDINNNMDICVAKINECINTLKTRKDKDVPEAKWEEYGRKKKSNYIMHERVGAEIALRLCEYLKFSKKMKESIYDLIKNHLKDECPLRVYDNAHKSKEAVELDKQKGLNTTKLCNNMTHKEFMKDVNHFKSLPSQTCRIMGPESQKDILKYSELNDALQKGDEQ